AAVDRVDLIADGVEAVVGGDVDGASVDEELAGEPERGGGARLVAAVELLGAGEFDHLDAIGAGGGARRGGGGDEGAAGGAGAGGGVVDPERITVAQREAGALQLADEPLVRFPGLDP